MRILFSFMGSCASCLYADYFGKEFSQVRCTNYRNRAILYPKYEDHCKHYLPNIYRVLLKL